MLINPKDINFAKQTETKVIAKKFNWHNSDLPNVIKVEGKTYQV